MLLQTTGPSARIEEASVVTSSITASAGKDAGGAHEWAVLGVTVYAQGGAGGQTASVKAQAVCATDPTAPAASALANATRVGLRGC